LAAAAAAAAADADAAAALEGVASMPEEELYGECSDGVLELAGPVRPMPTPTDDVRPPELGALNG